MLTKTELHAALFLLVKEIIDIVNEAGPEGVPGGHLYAPLMGSLSLDQFEGMMSALVQLGKVKKNGQVYHTTLAR